MELYITKRIYLQIYLVRNPKPIWKYYGWNRTATSHYRGWHFEWNLGPFQFGVNIDKFITIFASYSATAIEYREKKFGLYHKGFNDATEYLSEAADESLQDALYDMNPEKTRLIVKLFKEGMNVRIMNL